MKQKWFGDAEHVHVDSWIQLQEVDGFDVELIPRDNARKTIRKRVKAIMPAKHLLHTDNLLEIDDLIEISEVDEFQLRLRPSAMSTAIKVHNVFWRI